MAGRVRKGKTGNALRYVIPWRCSAWDFVTDIRIGLSDKEIEQKVTVLVKNEGQPQQA